MPAYSAAHFITLFSSHLDPANQCVNQFQSEKQQGLPRALAQSQHTRQLLELALKRYKVLVEFMNLISTRMPGKSYRRRLRSFKGCLCDVFRALINSPVCLRMYLWWSLRPLYRFTRMPGESHRRRLRSLLLYSCYRFLALINSLVC